MNFQKLEFRVGVSALQFHRARLTGWSVQFPSLAGAYTMPLALPFIVIVVIFAKICFLRCDRSESAYECYGLGLECLEVGR